MASNNSILHSVLSPSVLNSTIDLGQNLQIVETSANTIRRQANRQMSDMAGIYC